MKIYIRKSHKKLCSCGLFRNDTYSLIQNKTVKATICGNCYQQYINNLEGFELIFLTYDFNPRLPNFLRRLDNARI